MNVDWDPLQFSMYLNISSVARGITPRYGSKLNKNKKIVNSLKYFIINTCCI